MKTEKREKEGEEGRKRTKKKAGRVRRRGRGRGRLFPVSGPFVQFGAVKQEDEFDCRECRFTESEVLAGLFDRAVVWHNQCDLHQCVDHSLTHIYETD